MRGRSAGRNERFGENEATLAVHTVRYAASVLGDEACLAKDAPVKLTVPTPPGWRIQNVEAHSPDFESGAIAYNKRPDSLRCSLPQLENYALLAVTLRRGSR